MAYTEDFAGSEGALGGNWTTHADFVAVRKNGSGAGYNTTDNADSVSIYTGGTFADDQYSQCVLKDVTADNVSLILRATGAGATDKFYVVCPVQIGGACQGLYIGYYDGATFNELHAPTTTDISPAVATNDTVRAEIATYTITFKVNGTSKHTYTDGGNSIASGKAGIGIYDNIITIDDWEGGNLGGTTFNQSATGGFTPAGAILKQDAKVLTGAITPSGAILNQAGKVLAGAIAPAGVVTTLRTAYAVLTGAITPVGALVKETQRALTGAITPVGALLNQAQKVLSGDITPTSTLGTIKTFLLDLVGSIMPAGSLLKETQKIFTGSITPVGSLLKEIQKAFSGSITPAGAFAGIKVAFVVLVGSITPAGNLLRETQKTLTGVVTPSGLITKLTGKLLDGILAPTGALVTLFIGASTTMAKSTFKGMFRGMFRRMR